MSFLQSIARANDAQQARTSPQSGWGEFFAEWFGWPLTPGTRTSAEGTGPFLTKARSTVGPVQRVGEVQISTWADNIENDQQRSVLVVAAELRRTRKELQEAKDALGKLETEKSGLEQENNRLHDWLRKRLQDPRPVCQESQSSNLIEDLQVLEVENSSLKATNNDLESQTTILLGELQRVRGENDYLRQYPSLAAAAMTENVYTESSLAANDLGSRISILLGELQQVKDENYYLRQYPSLAVAVTTENFRRDLCQIRRRIIIEKTAKVLGKQYGQPKGKRESFCHWSKRVKYPDWQRMSEIGTRMIKQGNKVAHQATRAELQCAIDFVQGDDENRRLEEAEVLQKMLEIINDAGEIDEDEDDEDDEYDNELEVWLSGSAHDM